MNEGMEMNQKKYISNKPNLNEENNILEEYNLYEAKKIFLDNKSWKGNDLAWIMDDKSVCLSEHGDGGPYFINEIDLPKDAKIGEVYEKIDGKFIYNAAITEELNKIETEQEQIMGEYIGRINVSKDTMLFIVNTVFEKRN